MLEALPCASVLLFLSPLVSFSVALSLFLWQWLLVSLLLPRD